MIKKTILIFIFCVWKFSMAQLASPEFLDIKATPNEITISWTEVQGADGYEVYLIGKQQKVFYVGNTSIVCRENIASGMVYSIYVRAYTLKNNLYSQQINYCLLTPPLAISPKIQSRKNLIVASWQRKFKGNEYNFCLAEDSIFSKKVVVYENISTNKLKIKYLDKNKNYYYRLWTIDKNEKKHYSNIIHVDNFK